MRKKIIAAGHVCIDITPSIQGKKATKLTDYLAPGKLVQVGPVTFSTGGAVSNTGIALKIMGNEVALIGKVGNDTLGNLVKTLFEKKGCSSEYLQTSEKDETSYTVAIAIPGIDRIFFHNSGANNTFGADDIPEDVLMDAALLHFGYPSVMKKMYAEEGAETVRMMKKAHEAGVVTSLDMAMVAEDSEEGRLDWKAFLTNVLPHTDIFVPSVEELCYMLDKKRFYEWQERAAGRDTTEVITTEDLLPLAKECMDLGVKILMIKCGAPGMFLKTADEKCLIGMAEKLGIQENEWADQEFFYKSYKPEKVLSGTGAGDTSIAAFLTSLMRGYDPKHAMQMAAATGACCVEAYDSLSGIRTFEEMEEKLRAGWEQNE